MPKFTKSMIADLEPRSKQYDIREANGFAVRVNPSGSKTWQYLFDFEGRRRRMKLGRFPGVSLAEARKRHATARAALLDGRDPAKENLDSRSEKRAAPTFGDLAREYLERHAKNLRSGREQERVIRKELLPQWGDRKAAEITRRDVVNLLDSIVERGARFQANRTFPLIRQIFNFGVSRDLVPSSPCSNMRRPGGKEQSRDRVLTNEEIRALWNELDHAPISPTVRLVIRFALVTAQRIGEVVSMRWEDVDFESGFWTILGNTAKNEQSHRVPLSREARDLLMSTRFLARTSPWVFPSPSLDRHISRDAPGQAIRKNRARFGESRSTPHDLRRTAASRMASNPVPRLVIKKILNHTESDVTAVYDRHSYDAEKRDALNGWASMLTEIVNESPSAREATG